MYLAVGREFASGLCLWDPRRYSSLISRGLVGPILNLINVHKGGLTPSYSIAKAKTKTIFYVSGSSMLHLPPPPSFRLKKLNSSVIYEGSRHIIFM